MRTTTGQDMGCMAPTPLQDLKVLKMAIETKLHRAAGDLRELATKSADPAQADKVMELASWIEDIVEDISAGR
jgi:hypothetical protein